MGNRLFVAPNFISSLPNIPEQLDQRKNDFILRTARTETDEIIIQLPEGIYLESKANHILDKSSDFGSLTQELIFEKNQLIFKQTMVQKAYRGSPDSYNTYRNWLLELQQQWSPQVVFKKETRP